MILPELTILITDDPEVGCDKHCVAWDELIKQFQTYQYTSDFVEWHRRLTQPITIVIRPKDKDLKRSNSISSNPKLALQKLMWKMGVSRIIIFHTTHFTYNIKGQQGSLSWKNFI